MIETIRETVLRFHPQVEAFYLFGSHARAEQWPGSDLDLALLLPLEIAREMRPLACSPCHQALEARCRKGVDLVNLRLVSTVFQNEILNTGERVFTGDEEAALAFEMTVLSAYQKLNEERAEILRSFRETKRAYAI